MANWTYVTGRLNRQELQTCKSLLSSSGLQARCNIRALICDWLGGKKRETRPAFSQERNISPHLIICIPLFCPFNRAMNRIWGFVLLYHATVRIKQAVTTMIDSNRLKLSAASNPHTHTHARNPVDRVNKINVFLLHFHLVLFVPSSVCLPCVIFPVFLSLQVSEARPHLPNPTRR